MLAVFSQPYLQQINILCLLCMLSLCSPLGAATQTWTKGADGNFGESASWSGGSVPGVSDNAVLNTNFNVSSNLNFNVEQVHLSDGQLIILEGDTLNVTEGLSVTSSAELSGAGNMLSANLFLYSGNLSIATSNISQTIALYQGIVSGNLEGMGNLVKLGPGQVVLSGVQNTYAGNTVVEVGVLYAGADNVLSQTTDLVLSSGTFSLNGFSQTVHSVSGTGNLGSIGFCRGQH